MKGLRTWLAGVVSAVAEMLIDISDWLLGYQDWHIPARLVAGFLMLVGLGLMLFAKLPAVVGVIVLLFFVVAGAFLLDEFIGWLLPDEAVAA